MTWLRLLAQNRPAVFRLGVALAAIYAVALGWGIQHHLGNEAYRLRYLAAGVRDVARLGAARIDAAEAGRLTCELAPPPVSEPCPGAPEVPQCEAAGGCPVRDAEGHARLAAAMTEILEDLRHLPYFSTFHKRRLFGEAYEGREFNLRVALLRREADGPFMQVQGLRLPSQLEGPTYGTPYFAAGEEAGAIASAGAAWESGQVTQWVMDDAYRVYHPLRAGGATVGLLTLQAERERHSTLYVVGLVAMLGLWFIGVGVFWGATAAFLGGAWIVVEHRYIFWSVVAVVVIAFFNRRRLARWTARLLGRPIAPPPDLSRPLPPRRPFGNQEQ